MPTSREKHKREEKDRVKEKQMRKMEVGGGGGQFVPVFALRESISQPLKKDREA